MNGPDQPWEELHHHSYFLPELQQIEHDDYRMNLTESVGHSMVPLATHGIYDEGIMANLSPMILIKISWIPGKIKNVYVSENSSPDEVKRYTELFKEFHDVFAWSYE